MVNFLLDTSLSGEQLDYCHTISQSSEGLLMVINDILDLSKVEAGMMRLNSTWFRIHSLIEDANELLGAMAIQKNLELNYIVDEDVPLVVGGDRVRLRQVLLNVIGVCFLVFIMGYSSVVTNFRSKFRMPSSLQIQARYFPDAQC